MLTILNTIENGLHFCLALLSIILYAIHCAVALVFYCATVAMAYIAFGIAFGFQWIRKTTQMEK